MPSPLFIRKYDQHSSISKSIIKVVSTFLRKLRKDILAYAATAMMIS